MLACRTLMKAYNVGIPFYVDGMGNNFNAFRFWVLSRDSVELKAMPVNSCIGFKDLERFLANMVLQKR
jgi:hypothetical protein